MSRIAPLGPSLRRSPAVPATKDVAVEQAWQHRTVSFSRRTMLRVSVLAGGSLLVGALAACSGDETPGTGEPKPSAPLPTGGVASTAPISATGPTESTAPVTSAAPPSTAGPAAAPFTPNVYVRVDADDAVTLTIHRSEMGQGVRTALAMILAEELDVDFSTVRLEQATADERYGSQTTSGSGTVTDWYMPLRQAAAQARQILVAAAAKQWGVDAGGCSTAHGAVVRTGTSEQLRYGALVATAATLDLSALGRPALKDRADFTLIGTSPTRPDDAAIVHGTAVYGIDAHVPKMAYAVLARSPVAGGTLGSFDATEAAKVSGVRTVVKVGEAVAVVADNTWAAMKGRQALHADWKPGDNAVHSSASVAAQLQALVDADFPAPADAKATAIEAVYRTPYLAHAPMEPLTCVADCRSDTCEIWTATQNPQSVQQFVAEAVGVPATVHVTLAGGGFGRRLEVDFAVEAALVSKAIGTPVQVVWTREDDIRHDFYRMPTCHRMLATLEAGAVTQWHHSMAAPGINGVAYHAGREVLIEGLAVPYAIAKNTTHASVAPVLLPTGPWRAVMNGPNAFANECFLDELATALGRDPYELRVALLGDSSSVLPVVELVADKAGWGTAPPAGRGRGIAVHATYGTTPVAMVAEVSVDGGVIHVHRVVCAVDCGLVIDPDIVVQQMEGGIVYGLTSLLKGSITFAAGAVEQSNFDDYPLLQMAEMPAVEVHIVPSTHAPQGVGEMAVPVIVPAVLNAVFAATGRRIRTLPVRTQDLAAGA